MVYIQLMSEIADKLTPQVERNFPAIENQGARLILVFPEPTASFPEAGPIERLHLDELIAASGALSSHLELVRDTNAAIIETTTEGDKSADEEYYDPRTAADEFIDAKAADFYGTRALAGTPSSRMRVIQKSLNHMPELDSPTKTWVEKFNADNASKLGKKALETSVKLRVQPPANEDTVHPDSTSFKLMTAQAAFKDLSLREAILADMVARNDQAAYVISRLESWRKSQAHQPHQAELDGSRKCFDHVLFAIHEATLPQYIETFINAKQKELDISSPDAIA